MPEMHFLQELMILFGMGVFMVVAFHRLNLPPVLGFLITGVICGPFGFKVIDDIQSVETLAEIGLVLLLFEAGIEFSVKTFMKLKKFLLIAGGFQLLVTIFATMLITHLAGLPWATAAFLGMLISLSSTAIVLRILEYRGDFDSTHGRSAFSILIFQDLCIVPMVLVAPFLAGKGGTVTDALLLGGKALLFLVLAFTVARYLVPWLLNQVAKTKKREGFVLSIMLLCLGTAVATSNFGLSMALGAFIAGLVISDSKYNHQALGEILPFREVFNCLVFVSIGMLFDVRVLLDNPLMVLSCLALVLAVKAMVGAAATALAGHSLRVAILTGVTIAQVSEFSFVIAKIGLNVGLIDSKVNQLFLAVAILSMFVTPAFISGGHKLSALLERILPAGWTTGRGGMDPDKEPPIDNHVVIVGYGFAGRSLARSLAALSIPYVIVDQDPDIVKAEKAKGTKIFYGDSTRQEVLAYAGIARARVIAVTVSDHESRLRSIELARRLNPSVHVITRARLMDEVDPLIAVGAEKVVPEEFAGSIEILARVLENYLLPRDVIENQLDDIRTNHNRNWQLLYERTHPGEAASCAPCELAIELRRVTAGSPVHDQSLVTSQLRSASGVTVVAIQRADGTLVPNPRANDVLYVGDSAILMGTRKQLALAAPFFADEGEVTNATTQKSDGSDAAQQLTAPNPAQQDAPPPTETSEAAAQNLDPTDSGGDQGKTEK